MMQKTLSNLLAGLYLTLVYGFIFLPVATLVLFSFKGGRFPIPPFTDPTLKWYEAVFADPKLTKALTNSLIVGVASSALACLLGFFAAYGLARYHLPASGLQRFLLTVPLTVSYLIIGLGLLVIANGLGLSKSLWLVATGHVVINLPLCFAIIYASMGEHQRHAERAARDLGANELQVLRLITAPMLIPAIIVAFALALTLSWDEFIIAFLLSRFEVTLPVEIWSLLRSGLNPKTNAVGSVVFLVSITLVLILELTVFRRLGLRRKPGP
ncbi:MAG: ABC transporter permease [Pseudomonadota bacterium]